MLRRRRRTHCIAIALLAGALLMPGGAAAAAIEVDGERQTTAVVMQNGYQLVPASFFRGLNARVGWSDSYRSVAVGNDSLTIGFPAGQRFADYGPPDAAGWQRDFLATTTIVADGRAYIPLAYTARKLGMEVVYDERTKRTSIRSNNAAQPAREAAFAKQASGSGMQATAKELSWLYKITEAEAGGESYEGKVAVAATILNRVRSSDPEWPDDIVSTIFQVTKYNGVSYYQYSPVLDKRIYSAKPTEETKRAVDAALNGEDPSGGAIVFFNPDKTDNQWVRSREVTVVIGNHVFAK